MSADEGSAGYANEALEGRPDVFDYYHNTETALRVTQRKTRWNLKQVDNFQGFWHHWVGAIFFERRRSPKQTYVLSWCCSKLSLSTFQTPSSLPTPTRYIYAHAESRVEFSCRKQEHLSQSDIFVTELHRFTRQVNQSSCFRGNKTPLMHCDNL